MILRKPYAFIIKNFRIIHIIMFLCSTFLTIKLFNIYTFLTGYIKTGSFDYQNNLVGNYVNLYMYLSILLIVILSLVVIALFKWKKTNFRYYVVNILYYVIIFIGLIAMASFLEKVITTTIDTRVLKFYRDITLILALPGIYFFVTMLISGVGFNINKFDFSKDLKALNASVEDDEEFEFVVGNDTYKYKRKIRRWFREFTYYVRENTFLFSIFASILFVVLSVVLYLTLYVYNRTYQENESFTSNGLIYKVKESYLTNLDYSGKTISKNKLYLVIKLGITNNNTQDIEFNINNFRVLLDDYVLLPTMNKQNYFVDLGVPYNYEVITASSDIEYLFIYEMSDDYFNGSYTFRIVNDVNLLKGELAVEYNDTIVRPKYIKNIDVVGSYQQSTLVEFEKSALNESNLTIKSYEIKEKFLEKYTYCISNKCYTGKDVVKADNIGVREKTLIKLTIDYYIDRESNLYINALSGKRLFQNFGTISYLKNGEMKTIPLIDVTPNYMPDDKVYLEVPKEVEDALEVILNITIRDKKYIFILEN